MQIMGLHEYKVQLDCSNSCNRDTVIVLLASYASGYEPWLIKNMLICDSSKIAYIFSVLLILKLMYSLRGKKCDFSIKM